MPTGNPIPIPFPLSSFPGANPQEGAGRLINCYVEPLGDGGRGGIAPNVWRRSPGLSIHARTSISGYRGGLLAAGLSYECWLNTATTVNELGTVTSLGAFPGSQFVSMARNQVTPSPDVVAVDVDNGAFVLNTAAVVAATATATIGGTSFVVGDTVSLVFFTSADTTIYLWAGAWPHTKTYTVAAGASAATIASGLTALINADPNLIAAALTATAVGAVITIHHAGSVGNQTTVSSSKTGTGNETVTFVPAGGGLTGGAGLAWIPFAGAPLPYTANGVLPVANSVCFQDGYFFFTIGAGQVFATNLNSLEMSALAFINVGSRADVTLLRGIPYNGLLYLFTTGSCEVWQDTAQPPPGFPYSRSMILDVGLIQPNAIAGYETGFAELLWVDQDYSVQYLPNNTLKPNKVSPPDLDRLIEQQVQLGANLVAGCYYFAGHKFWHLSSPDWSWEFNLSTGKWNERASLLPSGIYGRWRGMGGHPAFNKFLLGDDQTGNLLFIDDQNYTEVGMPQLFRLESGPVAAFPAALRIARADFLFDMGVGQAVGNFTMTVTGTAADGNGVVRLTVNDTSQANTNDTVMVSGVGGTTEANGTWMITVIDATHINLIGSVWVNAYLAGGIAVDLTAPPEAVSPQCAVSWSLDGGLNFGNPLLRALGPQGRAKRARASVKNLGISSPMGNRYRLDVTDPVYTGFLMGTCSNDPREVGA